MSTSYLPYEPRQQQLLPSALQERLPEDHLAYFIDEKIEQLELSAFHARYEGGGPRNQPYHPAMMVKVLVHGYASGVFSSRRIAQKLHEDVAFRVLGAGNFPAARTIREFRRVHLAEFTALFVQMVRLARELGLVRLGTIAVDGTKVKANASRHKAMSYGRMKQAEGQLQGEIRALIERARRADEQEGREAPGWICRRRSGAGRTGSKRSGQPGHGWRNASERPTRQGVVGPMMNASRATAMAGHEAVAVTSASSGYRRTGCRAASPTRRRASCGEPAAGSTTATTHRRPWTKART